MTAFAPAIPAGGLAGLRFLDRTYEAQFAAFSRSPAIEREIAYFLENAGNAATAADLAADPRLLRVALGAFGLEEEAGKRAFVERILEEGTLEPDSLPNRLADPAWAEFSEAMGFGNFGSMMVFDSRREDIAERYRVRQFERAVGDQDVGLRLALNFRREITRVVGEASSDDAAWFRILGSRPLREVVEGALNLPQSFGQLDIDRQRSVLSERAARVLGTSSAREIADPDAVEQMISRYLAARQEGPGAVSAAPGAAALALLQTSGFGGGAAANLFRSRL